MVIALNVLNLADILTTVQLLRKGGIELNPLLTEFTPFTVLLKFGVVLSCSMAVVIGHHLAEKEKCFKAKVLVFILLAIVVGFYILVVINNLQVMTIIDS